MATEDQISLQERRKYLRIMQDACPQADRAGQGQLLDAMETATGLDRKTLIRLMGSDLKRRPRQRERGSTYPRDMDRALRVIAESYDYLCAERLTPNLLAMAKHLAAHGELHLNERLHQQLAAISVSTEGRLATTRLPLGILDLEADYFQHPHHGHPGLGPQSFDEAGGIELDGGGLGAHVGRQRPAGSPRPGRSVRLHE